MPKTVITPDIEKDILKFRLELSAANIGKRHGISGTAVLRFLGSVGLSLTKDQSYTIRTASMTGRTSFTAEQDQFIKDNYLTMPEKRMAAFLGKSGCGVRGRMRTMGLEVPPEIKDQRVKESRLKPGNIPFNKSKKQIEYMSPEQIARTVATRFQKEHVPTQTAPSDGVIRIRTDHGTGRKYKWIRISLGFWKMYHVVLWEQENGPVPDGYIIVFKDGDSLNTVPENLEMISFEENMRRNTIHRYPDEVRHIMQLRGAINRQINKRSKKNTDE